MSRKDIARVAPCVYILLLAIIISLLTTFYGEYYVIIILCMKDWAGHCLSPIAIIYIYGFLSSIINLMHGCVSDCPVTKVPWKRFELN